MARSASLSLVLVLDVLLVGIAPTLFLAHLLVFQVTPTLLGSNTPAVLVEPFIYLALFPFELLAPFMIVTLPVPPLVAAVITALAIALWTGNTNARVPLFVAIAAANVLELLALGLQLFWALLGGLLAQDLIGSGILLLAPLSAARFLLAVVVIRLNRRYLLPSQVQWKTGAAA